MTDNVLRQPQVVFTFQYVLHVSVVLTIHKQYIHYFKTQNKMNVYFKYVTCHKLYES
jgi:hypothetical protein